jgi:transposase-like protein
MTRYQTYSIEFKRQVAEEHLSGGTSLSQLARRHDISRELLRTWVKKYEAGEFAGSEPTEADRRAYEAKIAGLEGKVGQLTMELELLKRGADFGAPGERRDFLRRERPKACTVRAGRRVMSLAPSTYYDRPRARSAEAVAEEARLVLRIGEICADFPRYGYRRVTAQLRAEGERVNHKRVARIMREQDLCVRPKRRFVVTTNSDHDRPIFPDLAKGVADCEAILAMPGLGFAKLGPGDLGLALGYPVVPVEPFPPEMQAARARIFAACRRQGLAFLEGCTPASVTARLDEGILVVAGGREETARLGRAHQG